MASSYSTDLSLELVATGEKAGLWGTITNTNLQLLQQAVSGYVEVTLSTGTTTLSFYLMDQRQQMVKTFTLKL